MPGFDGEHPAAHPKAKFWRFLVKNCKKSAVKHSREKSSLLNFVDWSPTPRPRLQHPLGNIEIISRNSPLSLLHQGLNNDLELTKGIKRTLWQPVFCNSSILLLLLFFQGWEPECNFDTGKITVFVRIRG